jgi:transcriptional regulator with GAF, ATPase, and Fis domain
VNQVQFVNFSELFDSFFSQIEQLEELHKSEDAELEQMKEEFTKRIGESEAKLQAAAKVQHVTQS